MVMAWFEISLPPPCSLCSKFVTSCFFSDKVFDFIDLSRAHNDFGAIGLATRTLAAASDEYRTGSGSARVHVSPALEFMVAPDPVATAPVPYSSTHNVDLLVAAKSCSVSLWWSSRFAPQNEMITTVVSVTNRCHY